MQDEQTPNQSFTKNPATLILGGLLVVAAFAIGSMWTKLQTLKTTDTPSARIAEKLPSQPNTAPPPTQTAGDVPPVTDDDYIRGNSNADIVLVEYSDFECPFCKRFHPTMQKVVEEYDGKVAWVYRHFPLSFHANSQKAAEASECVGKIGGNEKFWEFNDLYFERTTSNGTGIALSKISSLAGEIGVDSAAVQLCMDNDEFAQKVKDQMNGGQTAGVSGTPGTILISKDGETELISGALPYPQVKQVIEKYLN